MMPPAGAESASGSPVATVGTVSWLTDPDEEWQRPDEGRADPLRPEDAWLGGSERRGRFGLVLAIVAGWLVVSLLVLGALLLFKGSSGKRLNPPTAPLGTSSSTPASVATPAASLPAGWALRASDVQTDCAAHSYGRVKTFFASTPCTGVHRYLASVDSAGRPVVVASSEVTFGTATQAARYLSLVSSDGTGNVNDLLREGVTYRGAPAKLPAAAFAARQQGSRILVAEAAFATGQADGSDVGLKQLANKAVGN
jgi:hypothetical protein